MKYLIALLMLSLSTNAVAAERCNLKREVKEYSRAMKDVVVPITVGAGIGGAIGGTASGVTAGLSGTTLAGWVTGSAIGSAVVFGGFAAIGATVVGVGGVGYVCRQNIKDTIKR